MFSQSTPALQSHIIPVPVHKSLLLCCASVKTFLFRPWWTRTSCQPWRQVSIQSHRSLGRATLHWTCCCCCCCGQLCGWGATGREHGSLSEPSALAASVAWAAAAAPPYSVLLGSLSALLGHLQREQRNLEPDPLCTIHKPAISIRILIWIENCLVTAQFGK